MRRTARWKAVAVGAGMTVSAVAALGAPANAWTAGLAAGAASCDDATGQQSAELTLSNPEGEAMTVTSSSNAVFSGTVSANGSASAVLVKSGDVKATVTETVHVTWPSEPSGIDVSVNVTFPGDCAQVSPATESSTTSTSTGKGPGPEAGESGAPAQVLGATETRPSTVARAATARPAFTG